MKLLLTNKSQSERNEKGFCRLSFPSPPSADPHAVPPDRRGHVSPSEASRRIARRRKGRVRSVTSADLRPPAADVAQTDAGELQRAGFQRRETDVRDETSPHPPGDALEREPTGIQQTVPLLPGGFQSETNRLLKDVPLPLREDKRLSHRTSINYSLTG